MGPLAGDEHAPTREVGGYRLLHALGSGGMGTVYEAIDAGGNTVALKLLHPGFSADESARARLRREVATLHRVKGASVAQVLDAEVESDEAFIVTELIDGQSLEESIQEHGPMDVEELSDLADGLAGALESIHKVGVLHRDLKPGNVMLTDDGPVVIDFGISQLADDSRITQTGLVTGTPGYVDPGVMHGKSPSQLGDWWGWAAVLVFAATGRQPFGRGPGVLMRVEAGRVDTDGLPPRVAQVLRRALHPDPEVRMPPEAVRKALQQARVFAGRTSYLPDASAADALAPEGPFSDDGAAYADPATAPEPLAHGSGRGGAGPAQMPPSYAPGSADEPEAQRTAYLPVQNAPGGEPARSESSSQGYAGPGYPDQQPGEYTPQWQAVGSEGGGYGRGNGSDVGALSQAMAGVGQHELPEFLRAPRPRPWLSLCWFGAAVALGVLYPAIVLMALCLVVAILGTAGGGSLGLRRRRAQYGLGKWDRAWLIGTLPLHAIGGILLVLPGALVGGLAAAIIWILGIGHASVTAIVAIAVAAATLLLWWTPSSGWAREGQRAFFRKLAPSTPAALAWAALGLVIAGIAAAVIFTGAAPAWQPFGEPPTDFFG